MAHLKSYNFRVLAPKNTLRAWALRSSKMSPVWAVTCKTTYQWCHCIKPSCSAQAKAPLVIHWVAAMTWLRRFSSGYLSAVACSPVISQNPQAFTAQMNTYRHRTLRSPLSPASWMTIPVSFTLATVTVPMLL